MSKPYVDRCFVSEDNKLADIAVEIKKKKKEK